MNQTISRHTKTDTRQLILRIARELLLTRSYLGLSFQELADRVGIRKASLYHHFASKEVLGIALMDDSVERFRWWTGKIAQQTPADQLIAYTRMFRDFIGAGQMVCPIGATGGEWECIEPALQDAVRRLHRTHLDWLAAVAARLEGQTDATLSPEQWAAHISATCQGALINARLYGDLALFDASVAPLRAQFSTSQ